MSELILKKKDLLMPGDPTYELLFEGDGLGPLLKRIVL